MGKILRTSIFVIACALLPAGVVAADFAAGAQAYDGGRYGDAFREWHALARAGDIRAQIAIAGIYRFGEGRPVDLRKAAYWYRLAADAGDPIAQLNFAEMLEAGLGVERDREAAWKWYDRAAQQGNAWAAMRRDRLSNSFKGLSRPPASR